MKRLLLLIGRFAISPLLLISLILSSSNAQTDYSLRIRALGVDFAGIIDDELTDVYLNPARTGIIDKKTLHATNLLGRSSKFPFPVSENIRSLYSPLISINESILYNYSYAPLLIGYLTPLWGGIKASFGFEAYLSGSDDLDSSSDINYSGSYGGYLRNWNYYRNSSGDTKHLLFDVTAAFPKGPGYLGIRVRGEHDENISNYLRSEDYLRILINPPYEVDEVYYYDDYMRKFEKTRFMIAFGTYKPESVLRDLVIGFSGTRYLFPAQTSAIGFEDSDADGNGTGFPSGNWSLEISRSSYDSNREYRELGTFARAHLRLGKKWRTVHTFGLTMGEGEGAASFEALKEYRDRYKSNHLSGHLRYDYDGDIASFSATTGVGRLEEIRKNMTFAWALKASYSRKEFDETGEGEVKIEIFGDDYADSLDQSNDYSKEYNSIEESYRAAFLFAFEWEINNFIVLRLGGYLGARHSENEYEYDQHMASGEPLTLYSFIPGGVMDYYIDYNTSVRLTNGIEIRMKDKLKLNLYMNSSNLQFADYNHIELRYCF